MPFCHLGMARQELNRTQVAGLPVDLCHLCPRHRMRAAGVRLQPDRRHPIPNNPRNLLSIAKLNRARSLRSGHLGVVQSCQSPAHYEFSQLRVLQVSAWQAQRAAPQNPAALVHGARLGARRRRGGLSACGMTGLRRALAPGREMSRPGQRFRVGQQRPRSRPTMTGWPSLRPRIPTGSAARAASRFRKSGHSLP